MTTWAEPLRPGVPVAVPAFPVAPVRGLVRLPGVYRPQADTCQLAEAIQELALPATRALDLCTGSGVLAILAARQGAGSVAAVDLSRRAVVSARLNARVRGLPVRVLRGGLPAAVAAGPYDLVVANPPYVPSPEAPSRATRGFDAGADGRSVLDTLCQRVTDLVNPGGSLLFVQSVMSGVDTSLEMLTAQGCQASVVRRVRVPFGPVLGGRLDFLAAAGLIEPGQQEEELVVIHARR